ncbi:TPA: hypothetical protein ACGCLF_001607 [Legionella pneumophila]
MVVYSYFSETFTVSVVGFLDEGLLVILMLLIVGLLVVSVVGFLDEGLLEQF